MKQYNYNNPKLKDLRRSLRKNQTQAEGLIWSKLRNRQMMNCKFYRQYSVGRYILDFYCPGVRVAIEIDGGQHNWVENQDLDAERTNYLNVQGINVIRFWNREVTDNLEGILQKIREVITPSTLPLRLRGREAERETDRNNSKNIKRAP